MFILLTAVRLRSRVSMTKIILVHASVTTEPIELRVSSVSGIPNKAVMIVKTLPVSVLGVMLP